MKRPRKDFSAPAPFSLKMATDKMVDRREAHEAAKEELDKKAAEAQVEPGRDMKQIALGVGVLALAAYLWKKRK